jgi:hypothetical protein
MRQTERANVPTLVGNSIYTIAFPAGLLVRLR